MANTLLQIRIDEALKNEAAAIYEALGFDLPTAIRVFLKRSVAEGGIPFDMKLTKDRYRSFDAWQLALDMGRAAQQNGTSEMSLDEINAEITASREARHDQP